MNAKLRGAAKACLLSTMTGLLFTSDGLALAGAPGRIRHADAEETAVSEPSPLATLGEARPIPVPSRTDTPRIAPRKSTVPAKTKTTAKARPGTAGKRTGTESIPSASKAAATAGAATVEEPGIEQTGALQNRTTGSRRSGTQGTTSNGASPALQATPPASTGTMSPIERELEELYRKNGRQMPEMNMQEFQAPQPETTPGPMPAARAVGQGGAMSGYQPGVRPVKPNFFERVFGFGRSRSKSQSQPRTSAPQPPRGGGANAPSAYGPYVPNATAPNSAPQNSTAPNYATPPTPPTSFRQAPTTFPAQTAIPPTAAPGTAPAQRPQQMREPTPLGPVAAPNSQYNRTSPRSANGINGGERQPLLDESKTGEDDDSLELSQDDETPVSRSAPQILPKQSTHGSAETPYSGLKIIPNESEESIARADELDKAFEDELASVKEPTKAETPSAAPKGTIVKPSPAAAGAALAHPLASQAKPAPSAAPTKTPPRSDDDELMELDDENDDDEDDDDDDDRSSQPSKAPAAGTPSSNHDEKPVFPRATAGGSSGAAPEGNASAPRSVSKETEKAHAASQTGFKGFCPVILKDERRLVEARSQFKSEYHGRTYTFSSFEAKAAFDEDPLNYVPAGDGADVVRLAGGESGVEGSLEHAAWYRGKLYLFSSAASRREFIEAPSRFNVKE